ncbi:hypothetical protein NDI37_08275 [Funiculus sociatus GB2-A5]|uniref:Uncharacterized protein n=1 Tax=Funiculus sociatus GB2-A5 TaxID=2933946 RepID=A0ABV0JM03_9CYAN|nr:MULTISPECIES: hypothetical protein [unclassified Trichocoleus]MBD1907234.1 hypothetical protein [Trichocoleus sp. FACHB-832]MBD2064277.1 hypothetical protein [Trichocoleus sp. FACHB-6]
MKWLVLLEGKESHLRSLTQLLRSPEWSVIKEEGSYYLSSSRFDLLTDDIEMYACATELLTLINGVAMFYFGDFKPFTLDVIVRVDENGKRHPEVLLSAIWTIEGFGFDIEGDESEDFYQHPSDLETWATIADQDEKVKKVFRIWTKREHDWVNLYKIYEVVQDDVGSRITEDGWATKKKTECFTRTAQSPDAIGDDARHGVEKSSQPPKSPMSLLEAQRLIIVIVRKWLGWKSKEQK